MPELFVTGEVLVWFNTVDSRLIILVCHLPCVKHLKGADLE